MKILQLPSLDDTIRSAHTACGLTSPATNPVNGPPATSTFSHISRVAAFCVGSSPSISHVTLADITASPRLKATTATPPLCSGRAQICTLNDVEWYPFCAGLVQFSPSTELPLGPWGFVSFQHRLSGGSP